MTTTYEAATETAERSATGELADRLLERLVELFSARATVQADD
jgi:hypothetical protein